jgi:mycothiol synthase
MRRDAGGEWGPLTASALSDVVAVATRVLASDGGHPLAGDEAFIAARYTADGVLAHGRRAADGSLIAVASVRLPEPSGSTGGLAVVTGMVDPDHRGRGLGAYALDWALATARGAGAESVTVETESLSDPAETLFASRGLRQVFAEDVMRFDLAVEPPVAPLPAGLNLATWTPELAGRFFDVYDAAFRDRPGFPGWSATRWIEWISEDEDFRPAWSLLATDSSVRPVDVGFIACAVGWIVQVGVRPDQRGRGLGAALVVEALRRMRESGAPDAMLDVNVDNPAARLYGRLGFQLLGRRARFSDATPAG